MTSTIATNMGAVRAHNVFEQNNAKMAKAMDHATTGLRINSAQEGAANWAISERMRERVNSLNQAQQNTQNDIAMLKTAEGGIANTVDLLRTSKALVLQAVDASANDNDRDALAAQLKQVLEQISDNANNTKYNGKVLIAPVDDDGSDTEVSDSSSANTIELNFQVGDSSGAVISGIQLENMTLAGLSLDGVASAITDAGSYFRGTDGSALLDTLDEALTTALNAATDVGAYEQRLGFTADNLSTQIENLEASDSTIRDADMAKEIANYMKYNVLSQASQYMLAQSNQNAFSVLNLLQ